MNKIDEQVKNAVANWKAMRGNNTKVEIVGGCLKVYLYDNLIFWAESPSKWNARNCGWSTATTRARLNACLAGVGSSLGVYSQGGEMRLTSCAGGKSRIVGGASRWYRDSFNSEMFK